jgi:hypothetical protein
MLLRRHPRPQKPLPQPVVNAFAQSTFYLEQNVTDTETGEQLTYAGTGFIGPDGPTTAKHLLQSSPKGVVTSQWLFRHRQKPLNVTLGKSHGDVALLDTDQTLEGCALPLRDLDNNPLKPGEPLFYIKRQPALQQSQPIVGAALGYRDDRQYESLAARIDTHVHDIKLAVRHNMHGPVNPLPDLLAMPDVQASSVGQSIKQDEVKPSNFVLYDANSAETAGSSGSCVLDAEGQVIGIHSLGSGIRPIEAVTLYLPTGHQLQGYGIAQKYPKQF